MSSLKPREVTKRIYSSSAHTPTAKLPVLVSMIMEAEGSLLPISLAPRTLVDPLFSIALFEIAKQLVGTDVTNAVRFAWWSAEESGLLGSHYFVDTAAQEELDKIRLYLNFDMIASPNFSLFAYDGGTWMISMPVCFGI